jgi:outer membrane protein
MKKHLFTLLSLLALTASAQTDTLRTAASVPAVAVTPVGSPADTSAATPVVTPSSPAAVPAIRFGYLSYETALKAMPQYALLQQRLDELRKAYDQEAQRVEQEFNEKYEAFLEGQRDFPRTILLKRQTELEQLMQRNIAFKAQMRQELQDVENDGLMPLRARLNETLAVLAQRYGLALVINTDANACPFIDPVMGRDIQEEVIALLSR